ncbi:hypothetical protein WA026_000111, partial [Henosepilachna vigintioctopunctata]
RSALNDSVIHSVRNSQSTRWEQVRLSLDSVSVVTTQQGGGVENNVASRTIDAPRNTIKQSNVVE